MISMHPRICTILLLIKTSLQQENKKKKCIKNSVFYINVSCDLFANSIHSLSLVDGGRKGGGLERNRIPQKNAIPSVHETTLYSA